MLASSDNLAGLGDRNWDHGHMNLQDLRPGTLIDVETKSRHYRIEYLGGTAIRISGHPDYCPTPTPAHLHGSIANDGTLEFGQIEPGMKLMFFLNDNRAVTTSRIMSVRVANPDRNQPASAPPPSSPSIH